jgi:hypothetical protein
MLLLLKLLKFSRCMTTPSSQPVGTGQAWVIRNLTPPLGVSGLPGSACHTTTVVLYVRYNMKDGNTERDNVIFTTFEGAPWVFIGAWGISETELLAHSNGWDYRLQLVQKAWPHGMHILSASVSLQKEISSASSWPHWREFMLRCLPYVVNQLVKTALSLSITS